MSKYVITYCKMLSGVSKRGKVSYDPAANRFCFETFDGSSFIAFPFDEADKFLITLNGRGAELRSKLMSYKTQTMKSQDPIEKSCSCCGKMNDNGIKTCWWCGNEP